MNFITELKQKLYGMKYTKKKLIVTNDNLLYINNILNKLDLETYIYNRTLLQMINKTDINIYSFTCIPKDDCDINKIKDFVIDHCKNEINNIRIENNHLIFRLPNKIKNSPYKYINIYINIFSKNIKFDVYFTLLNLKLNINSGILSLINEMNEFEKEYFKDFNKSITNNKEFYNMCINDLNNNNIQFILSHKLNYFVKKKFFNKYQFKNRIDYYLNKVFNFIPNESKNELLNMIDDDFKKKNNMSLKYLIVEPKNITDDDICLICLEKLNSEDCFRLPCCKKLMHKNCIIECENHDHRCPNCRKNWTQ